jgi:hypothetical protein
MCSYWKWEAFEKQGEKCQNHNSNADIFQRLPRVWEIFVTFTFLSFFFLSLSLPLNETMIEESNWVPLVLSIVCLFFIVVWLVSFYSNLKTQPWYVSMVCIVGWFFPFWIVLLLPLDMASVG